MPVEHRGGEHAGYERGEGNGHRRERGSHADASRIAAAPWNDRRDSSPDMLSGVIPWDARNTAIDSHAWGRYGTGGSVSSGEMTGGCVTVAVTGLCSFLERMGSRLLDGSALERRAVCHVRGTGHQEDLL